MKNLQSAESRFRQRASSVQLPRLGPPPQYSVTIDTLDTLTKGDMFIIIPHQTYSGGSQVTIAINGTRRGIYLYKDGLSTSDVEYLGEVSNTAPMILIYDGGYLACINAMKIDSSGISSIKYADVVVGVSGNYSEDEVDYLFTNGSTVLQTAINAVPTGGTLLILPGTYAIEDTLTISKPITIIGSGVGSTIIKNNGNVQVLFSATGVNNITIKDLSLRYSYAEAISIKSSTTGTNSNFIFENIECDQSCNQGIVISGQGAYKCSYVYFKNCRIIASVFGTQLMNTSMVFVDNCYFYGSPYGLFLNECVNMFVNNSVLSGDSTGVIATYANELHISNSEIDGSMAYPLNYASENGAHNLYLTGCRIYGGTDGPAINYLSNGYFMCTGNYIFTGGSVAIIISGSGKGVITGNVIDGSISGGSTGWVKTNNVSV